MAETKTNPPGVQEREEGLPHSQGKNSDCGAGMKIISWNVNSLPACLKRLNKSKLVDFLEMWGREVSIVCIQETKMSKEMLNESYACPEGWECVYTFYTRGPSSKSIGYSGVATYMRKGAAVPVAVHTSLGWNLRDSSSNVLEGWDDEGRCIVTDHVDFLLYNIYAPASRCVQEKKEKEVALRQQKITDLVSDSAAAAALPHLLLKRGDGDDEEEGSERSSGDATLFAVLDEERHNYKRRFFSLLEQSVRRAIQSGRKVIVVGDMNVAIRKADHCDPVMWEKDMGMSYDNSEFRMWMVNFLKFPQCKEDGNENVEREEIEIDLTWRSAEEKRSQDEQWSEKRDRLLDMFRVYYPERKSAFTCWNQRTFARETNYGTRIDYILASRSLQCEFESCDIMPTQEGSDHCPVIATMRRASYPVPSLQARVPPLGCASRLPQFRKRQKSIMNMFQRPSSTSTSTSTLASASTPASTSASTSASASASTSASPLTSAPADPTDISAGSTVTLSCVNEVSAGEKRKLTTLVYPEAKRRQLAPNDEGKK